MYKKRALFYPCAGRDIDSPVRAFESSVDEFWFVDTSPKTYGRQLLLPIKVRTENVETTRSTLTGTKFHVITHRYKTTHFNKTIEIHLVTGDGITVFHRLFCSSEADRSLAVFFHRGDSRGEGGSDIYWLSNVDGDGNPNTLLAEVLGTISKPGVLCTDGSNAEPMIARYFNDHNAPPNAHMQVDEVAMHGCILSPIGTLDAKYGQAIAWQVKEQ